MKLILSLVFIGGVLLVIQGYHGVSPPVGVELFDSQNFFGGGFHMGIPAKIGSEGGGFNCKNSI